MEEIKKIISKTTKKSFAAATEEPVFDHFFPGISNENKTKYTKMVQNYCSNTVIICTFLEDYLFKKV